MRTEKYSAMFVLLTQSRVGRSRRGYLVKYGVVAAFFSFTRRDLGGGECYCHGESLWKSIKAVEFALCLCTATVEILCAVRPTTSSIASTTFST